MDYTGDKSFRLLHMKEILESSGVLRKKALAEQFGVTEKTLQRDIDHLRIYLTETGGGEIIYDRQNNCYRLRNTSDEWLNEQEIYALCKILIESRAFNREEFKRLVAKLLALSLPESRRTIEKLIANERVGYLPLRHGQALIEKIWQLSQMVSRQKIIQFQYRRQDGAMREHTVKPVGIMFSEFYFYLLAYMENSERDFPTVYRIDRISGLKATGTGFQVPYAARFSETEFRKRVQFMYAGELHRVRFLYTGVVESILDRLPTAKVEKKTEDGVIITAEAYGNGIDMWLRSQGDRVKIL